MFSQEDEKLSGNGVQYVGSDLGFKVSKVYRKSLSFIE